MINNVQKLFNLLKKNVLQNRFLLILFNAMEWIDMENTEIHLYMSRVFDFFNDIK